MSNNDKRNALALAALAALWWFLRPPQEEVTASIHYEGAPDDLNTAIHEGRAAGPRAAYEET